MKLTTAFLAPFILISIIALSCNSDSIWSNSSAEAVKKEISTTLQQYHKDIAEKGMLAEIPYLDSSANFSWLPPGYDIPIGYDSVVTVLKLMAPMYFKIEHHWDTLAILPGTKSMAIYVGEVTSMLTDTAGTIDTIRFKEEGSMMKRESGWKLVSGKTVIIE